MKKRFIIPALFLILLVLVPPVPAVLGPSITQVSPISGPNDAVVTITVTGSSLDTTTVIRLNKCRLKTGTTGQPVFYGTIISKDAGSVTATFDLHDKVIGNYDVSLNAPWNGQEAWAVAEGAFSVYQGSGSPPPVTPIILPATTTATAAPTPQGKNGVVFESSPPGASVQLDGMRIGTTPFIYYTDRDGTFNVVFWKEGYADYETRVAIYEGRVVHLAAPLTLKSAVTATTSTTIVPTTVTKTAATTARVTGNATPARTPTSPAPPNTTVKTTATATGTVPPATGIQTTTLPPYTIVVPTPWPTDTPGAKQSPADPLGVPCAACLAMALVLHRRR